MIIADKEKFKMILEYKSYGATYIADKYRYGSRKSAINAISTFKKDLKITVNKNQDTNNHKINMIEEYYEHGAKYIMEKYNFGTIRSVYTAICKYKKDLDINTHSQKTEDEKSEIIKYSKKYSMEKAAARYKVSRYSIYSWLKKREELA